MKRGSSFYALTLLLGFGLMVTSFMFKGEEVKVICGILMGVGAGLLGMSASNLFMKRLERKNPKLQKLSHIEYHDERNIMIRNRAKAKAADMTQWLIIAIGYMTIIVSAPLWVTLSAISVFLLYQLLIIYLTSKYQREM